MVLVIGEVMLFLFVWCSHFLLVVNNVLIMLPLIAYLYVKDEDNDHYSKMFKPREVERDM